MKKHLNYLRKVFRLLNSFNIRLSFKKLYLNYSIVVFLKQKIDAFDFIIIVNKLIIIINLRFSYIFKNFEKYFEFTNWLRNYITWYTQKSKSLQVKKTMLLRSSLFNKNRQRKIYFLRIVLNKFFDFELKIYRQLQKTFNNVNLLIYYDFTWVLYIDINVFKRRNFDVIIYHLKFNANFNNFKRKKI